MEKVTFGKTGLQVTRLGFGAAPVGYLSTEQDKINEILTALLDEGVNLIDTAACYPGSEAAIGQAVSQRRDEYILVTKCGHKDDELPGEEWSAQLITASIDRSLKRLKTDRLDVLLLHTCTKDVLVKGEALEALVKARDAGKVRFLGYSGDNADAAYAAALPEVEVVETSVSIADQANIKTVLPVCRANNVGVIAKRPLANAAWKDLSKQRGIYQKYAETYTQRLSDMGIMPQDVGFQGHPDVDWPELALRFTLCQPGVHTAIVGTTSKINAMANLEAADKRPLPENVVLKLRDAFDKAERAAGEPWLGLA